MNREYHSWYSPFLDREMELLVFGHAGAKVLIFPSRGGRFYEYENLRIVNRLRDRVEAGELQLFCVNGVDRETFYCSWRTPRERIERHIAYENYVLHEVMPLMGAMNDNPVTIAHGCSLGAFQAANFAFRHPHLFQKLVAFSGRYDPTMSVEFFDDLLDGYRDDDVYYNTPVAYLPDLDGWRLDALRAMEIVLVIGREDPFLENNRYLSEILWRKGVEHRLEVWEERAHRGYYWRRMAPQYVAPPTGGKRACASSDGFDLQLSA